MPATLQLAIGQYSDKGRKEINQDFHGALIPGAPLLQSKGIAIALADGISSSPVSRIAAESAVKGFLTDYYCTSDAWTVKTSAQRVITATNSWLYAQTRRGPHAHDRDRGYVCTLTVLVARSRAAHLFHIGDARVYRVSGASLEQLTNDHRVVVSSHETYLGRALGINEQVEIDYQVVPLEVGDVFVLATDGVYEHVPARCVVDAISAAADLDAAAEAIVTQAYDQGSADNLTVQIVRVDALPDGDASDVLGPVSELPPPPLLEPRMLFDGYEILREIHASSRSHIYLATDTETGRRVAIKLPSIDLRGDPGYLRRFMQEEWVARRVNSAHVLRPLPPSRKRNYLYLVNEYVEGQTLAQWMTDHPQAELETVRSIIEQIAAGLRAFHRLEMLHQDLRPANVLIDDAGTVKIIDFGSARVAGVAELAPASDRDAILGTVQYTAPEYLLGDGGSPQADIFSLGVIAYQMLTGALPYGARMAQARTRSQQRKIDYRSARAARPALPIWVDGALRKSVHPDPARRYQELSEFLFDLRHPGAEFARPEAVSLLERNPVRFWQVVALLLALGNILLLAYPLWP